jgi:exodeoxyribonuclease V beta subunit
VRTEDTMPDIHPVHQIVLSGRCLIEASAGTGKTWSIAKLFVRGLLEKRLRPRQILVVTFTNAATKELRERLYSELLDCEQWLLSGGEAEHAFYSEWQSRQLTQLSEGSKKIDFADLLIWIRYCLTVFDEAGISTLQSFCESIVARYSMEMGIDLVVPAVDEFRAAAGEASNGAAAAAITVFIEQVTAINELIHADKFDEAAYLYLALGGFDLLKTQVIELLNKPSTEPKSQTDLNAARQRLIQSPIIQASADLRNSINEQSIHELMQFGNQYLQSAKPNANIKPKQFNEAVLALKEISAGAIVDVRRCEMIQKLVSGLISKASFVQYAPDQTYTCAKDLPIVQAVQQFWPHFSAFEALADNFHEALVTSSYRLAKQALLDGNDVSFSDSALSFTRTLILVAQALLKSPDIASKLRMQYPLALIDEFQDTDPIQASIVDAIYPPQSQIEPSWSVIFVGDPKQAIYNFRGADVYAYLNAKQSAKQIYTLAVNQRSVPRLVAAVNDFFSSTPKVFDVSGIDFHPAKASARHEVLDTDLKISPFSMVQISNEVGALSAWQWTAQEVATLILAGHYEPAQIAILVRSNASAKKMQAELLIYGVNARLGNSDSIWRQPEASQLAWFLEGVLHFKEAPILKRALMTPIAGNRGLQKIRSLDDSVLSQFANYRATWLEQGLAALWLTCKGQNNSAIFAHLVEIVLTETAPSDTPETVIEWMNLQIELALNENSAAMPKEAHKSRGSVRDNLVHIGTIHSAKGLQYPVVFLPDAFVSPKVKPKYKLGAKQCQATYYEENLQLAVNLQAEKFQSPEVIAAAIREQQREEIRLLYVALTRAEQACFVLVPTSKAKPDTSLLRSLLSAYLAQTDTPVIEAVTIQTLAIGPGASIDSAQWTEPTLEVDVALANDKLSTSPAQLSAAWRIDSFSALAKRSENEKHGDVKISPSTGLLPSDGFGFNLTALPKGSHTGECLHGILEDANWQAPMDIGVNFDVVQRQMNRFGLNLDHSKALALWMESILATPILSFEQKSLSLRDIAPDKQIREWRFDSRQSSNSYLRGFVDLLFEYAGKTYVVDYKSNWLGQNESDYSTEALAAAMNAHQYDLQARIYAAAAKKFMSSRTAQAELQGIENRFGGVLYLYLRAMNPERPGLGVFHVA